MYPRGLHRCTRAPCRVVGASRTGPHTNGTDNRGGAERLNESDGTGPGAVRRARRWPAACGQDAGGGPWAGRGGWRGRGAVRSRSPASSGQAQGLRSGASGHALRAASSEQAPRISASDRASDRALDRALDRDLLETSSLALGEAAPDAEPLVLGERVLKAFGPDFTGEADLLRLAGGSALLRKKDSGSVWAHSARSCQPSSSSASSTSSCWNSSVMCAPRLSLASP